MKYQFPIRVPEGRQLFLAQGFKVGTPTDFSEANSVAPAGEHLGVDITAGTGPETWGLPCVWPFPFPGVVYDAEVDSPFNAKLHAHSQIDGIDPQTGIKYSLMYLHLSSVVKTKLFNDPNTVTYFNGQTIGAIGNNGAVQPMPTPEQPFAGTHLHLGLGVQKPGELNSTLVDPLLYFDITNPFTSPAVGYKFNNTLLYGKHNPENTQLQKVLQKGGWFDPHQLLTDYYGDKTAAAIVAFRKAKGVDGSSDPLGHSCGLLTRAELNKL